MANEGGAGHHGNQGPSEGMDQCAGGGLNFSPSAGNLDNMVLKFSPISDGCKQF